MNETLEISLWSVSFSLLALYHVYFVIHYLKEPESFNLGVNLKSRQRWALIMMTDKSREITAVQTLRNGIMTTTFLATAAYVIGFYIFNILINQTDRTNLETVQFAILGVDFMSTFINMLVATRGYFHCSFLIVSKSLDPEIEAMFYENNEKKSDSKMEMGDLESTSKSKESLIDKWTMKHVPPVVKLLSRSSLHFTIGVRFLYLAIPLALWIFSPWAFLISSLLMVILMYYLDHSV